MRRGIAGAAVLVLFGAALGVTAPPAVPAGSTLGEFRTYPVATDGQAGPADSTVDAYAGLAVRGVSVAVGDVNADATVDVVTGPGPGAAAPVRIHAGDAPTEFTAFAGAGGTNVAVGNFDEDADLEIVAAVASGGPPSVRVFQPDGTPMAAAFSAYETGFGGGVRVAAGDVNGDGVDEIVTAPGPGRAPTIRRFTFAGTEIGAGFLPYDSEFLGGAFVATGNLTDATGDEIITGAGPGAGPHVRRFTGTGTALDGGLFPYDPAVRAGVRVAAADLVSGGPDELIVAAGAERPVRVLSADGMTEVDQIDPPGAGPIEVAAAPGLVAVGNRAPRIDPPTEAHPLPNYGIHRVEFPGEGLTAPLDATITGVDVQGQHVAGPGSGALYLRAALSATDGVRSMQLENGDGERVDVPGAIDVFSVDFALEVTTGAGPGGGPHVRSFIDPEDDFGFFSGSGTAGVRVARFDLDGDGFDEVITSAGPGQSPRVRIHAADGTLLTSFLAYEAAFRGGVFVAASDVDGDGTGEIITGAGAGGGPHVRVFTGNGTARGGGFMAFSPAFAGGVAVAAGDVDGDGAAEIITGAGPGGGPHVRVVTASGEERGSFFAYPAAFPGGVDVAAGDIDGDGVAEIVTGAGPGGGPHVRVFSGTGGGLHSFFAYAPTFGGGVEVAAGDLSGDGVAELITGAGPGGGPHVRVLTPAGGELASFYAYDPAFHGGVDVAAGVLMVPSDGG